MINSDYQPLWAINQPLMNHSLSTILNHWLTSKALGGGLSSTFHYSCSPIIPLLGSTSSKWSKFTHTTPWWPTNGVHMETPCSQGDLQVTCSHSQLPTSSTSHAENSWTGVPAKMDGLPRLCWSHPGLSTSNTEWSVDQSHGEITGGRVSVPWLWYTPGEDPARRQRSDEHMNHNIPQWLLTINRWAMVNMKPYINIMMTVLWNHSPLTMGDSPVIFHGAAERWPGNCWSWLGRNDRDCSWPVNTVEPTHHLH